MTITIVNKREGLQHKIVGRYSNNVHRTFGHCLHSCEVPVPQIKKALRTKDTEDVSVRFLLVLVAGLSLWVIYGIGRADIVIVIGNSIGASLNIWMLVLKMKYSREPLEEQ